MGNKNDKSLKITEIIALAIGVVCLLFIALMIINNNENYSYLLLFIWDMYFIWHITAGRWYNICSKAITLIFLGTILIKGSLIDNIITLSVLSIATVVDCANNRRYTKSCSMLLDYVVIAEVVGILANMGWINLASSSIFSITQYTFIDALLTLFLFLFCYGEWKKSNKVVMYSAWAAVLVVLVVSIVYLVCNTMPLRGKEVNHLYDEGYCQLISSYDSNLAVSIDGDKLQEGQGLQLQTNKKAKSQILRYKKLEDNKYIFMSNNGKYALDIIDIENGTTNDVHMYQVDENIYQQWYVEYSDENGCAFINTVSDKSNTLDMCAGGGEGTPIQTYSYHGGETQRYIVDNVAKSALLQAFYDETLNMSHELLLKFFAVALANILAITIMNYVLIKVQK